MNLMGLLFLVLIFLVVVTVVLALVYLKISLSEKSKSETSAVKESKDTEKVKAYKEYTIESIYDFMEFDKIQDNMIVQKDGKRYLMVIECQGINYDLMSEVEKNSVEMGFMKVLNTLREPIQIYIQTRTINLESSLERYKGKLRILEDELLNKQMKYKQMKENNRYTDKELQDQRMEIIRQENLCEYGKDIIANTERMSLNKNILIKKYYIVSSHYANNDNGEYLDKEEIKENAFSDLYTRCQSIIRALSSAEVVGRVMTSDELVDLLYNSYNRDEAETYGVNKAIEAGYDDLYVTAPDVIQKRMVALDKEIEEKALDMAEEAVIYATNRRELEEKEENIDDLINEFAKQLVEENRQYLGDDITNMAKEKINNKVEGEKKDGKKTKTTRKRTKQQSE